MFPMTQDKENYRKTSRGQKPDIPPRSNSLKMHSRVTRDVWTKLPSIPDKTIGNTFKKDSIKLPIPIPIYEKCTQQDPLNVPLPQTSIYKFSMREKNVFTHSKMLSVEIDTFGHIRMNKYEKNENFDRDKDVAGRFYDQLHRTAQLKGK